MNRKIKTRRRLMACVSDPSRLRIVLQLGRGELCVTELAQAISLSQSCTTRHLQTLGEEGVVHRRRDGKRVLFRLNDDDPHFRRLFLWISAGERADAPEGAGAAATDVPAGSGPAPTAAATKKQRPRGAITRPATQDETAGNPDAPPEPESGKKPGVGPAPDRVPESPAEETRPMLRRGDLEDYLL
jgi:ArsR family transcriptional regulator